MIVLDTNVIISYIQDEADIVKWIQSQRLAKEVFAISVLTATELLGYHRIVDAEFFFVEKWIASVLTVNIDLSLAREAGRIRRELRVNTVDSIIAATAVLLNCPIATRDLDFKKIRDVKVIVPGNFKTKATNDYSLIILPQTINFYRLRKNKGICNLWKICDKVVLQRGTIHGP